MTLPQNIKMMTFLISGILGVNRWEICEMTSWING
jgi:hypothetical protein